MSSYFYNFDPEEAYALLEDNAIHFHISGADGLDGEGKGLSSLKENEHRILKKMLKSSKKCVVDLGFSPTLPLPFKLDSGDQ